MNVMASSPSRVVKADESPPKSAMNTSDRTPTSNLSLPAASSRQQLNDAIHRYQAALPPCERAAFPLTSLDRTGVPVWAISYRGENGYLTDSIGYGAVDDEARVGALGELTEDVHLADALRECPRHLAVSYSELAQRCGEEHVIDPLTLCLPAGSPYTPDMPLDWVSVKRVRDDAEAWVPSEFVAFDTVTYEFCSTPGREPLAHPISNGMGAGLTRAQAIKHGLLELLQRDGNSLAFRALDRGITVALDSLQNESLIGILRHAHQLGIRVLVKVASTEFNMANVYVVGYSLPEAGGEAFPLQLTACGEAVHPCRETAIRKAVLEFLAARARKTFMHGPLEAVEKIAPPGYLEDYEAALPLEMEESRSIREMNQWLGLSTEQLRERLAPTVFQVAGTVRAKWLPDHPEYLQRGHDDLLKLLSTTLGRHSMECYYFDASHYSHSCQEHGVHSIKAIVPGLECETMSYYRIGLRGVLKATAEELPFVSHRGGSGWLPVRLTDRQQDILGHASYLNPELVDQTVGPLYPLYREPNSHVLQILGRKE